MNFNLKKLSAMCALFSASLILSSISVKAGSDTPPKYTWDESIPMDVISGPENDFRDHVRLEAAEILLTDQLSANVIASIKFKLDRDLRLDGSPVRSDFNVEDFVKAAHIEIKNVGGRPVAFVIGKQEVAFGFDTTHMPIPKESPLHELTVLNEVIGFTVALDTNFQLFDKVEASVFETKGGDMKIGTMDGYAVRLNKDITERLQIKASAMHLGNSQDPELGVENRQSIGVIYKTKDNRILIWAEGVHSDNNPLYKESKYAVTTGFSTKMGPGDIAVDATFIPASLKKIGIGYSVNLTKSLVLGAQVNYTHYESNMNLADGPQVGIQLKYVFGGHSAGKDSDVFKNLKKR
ncbi:MAG: hypothetical protein H7281_06870 [Bacteriovorax sp.]|nr:hypothetical protein [Bacteriovorax sp.]